MTGAPGAQGALNDYKNPRLASGFNAPAGPVFTDMRNPQPACPFPPGPRTNKRGAGGPRRAQVLLPRALPLRFERALRVQMRARRAQTKGAPGAQGALNYSQKTRLTSACAPPCRAVPARRAQTKGRRGPKARLITRKRRACLRLQPGRGSCSCRRARPPRPAASPNFKSLKGALGASGALNYSQNARLTSAFRAPRRSFFANMRSRKPPLLNKGGAGGPRRAQLLSKRALNLHFRRALLAPFLQRCAASRLSPHKSSPNQETLNNRPGLGRAWLPARPQTAGRNLKEQRKHVLAIVKLRDIK